VATKRHSKSDSAGIDPPCEGLKQGGERCSARRVAGSNYCFFHDPDKEAERKAAQSAGGQKNKMAVLASSTPDAKLQNSTDTVKLLADTINQVLRGEIDPKIANAVGYLVGLYMKAQHNSEIERRLIALESALKRQPIAGSSSIDDEEWVPPSGEENVDH
jgi:hypothetical protein